MRGSAWAAALLIVLAASAAAAARIYKWSDSQGQTHYSELPPVGHSAQALDIRVPPGHPLASEPATPVATPVVSASNPGESDRRAQPAFQDLQSPPPSCKLARQNLHYLQAGPGNRRFRDPSGRVVRYTEAQRQAKIAATAHYLEQNCSTR